MATAESAGKTCMVCGKDVAGKPRVKDAAGHYMCEGACQQKAIAAAQARKDKAASASTPKPGVIAPPKQPVESGGGLLSNLIEDSPMLRSARCESCGSAMPGGSVLCTRCGFNTQTGKALKTAVIVEKEKKQPRAASSPNQSKYASSNVGPDFGVLFLITAGVVSATFALGFVSPGFWFLGLVVAGIVQMVGLVWGIVDAFRQGETMWGILGVLTPIVGVTGLGFLYYMIFVNELKWSRAIYLGAIVGAIVGLAIGIAGLGIDFNDLLAGKLPK